MEKSPRNTYMGWITITKRGTMRIWFQLTYCLWTLMMEPNYFIGKRVSPGAFLPPLLIYLQLIAVSLEFQLLWVTTTTTCRT